MDIKPYPFKQLKAIDSLGMLWATQIIMSVGNDDFIGNDLLWNMVFYNSTDSSLTPELPSSISSVDATSSAWYFCLICAFYEFKISFCWDGIIMFLFNAWSAYLDFVMEQILKGNGFFNGNLYLQTKTWIDRVSLNVTRQCYTISPFNIRPTLAELITIHVDSTII